MYKETKELYFADDCTPFEENKEACEVYDVLYHKLYKMIEYGRVLFWNSKGELVWDKLLSYKWNTNDKLCYYDWLKKQLYNIAYFRIVVDRNTAEFEEVWNLLRCLLCFDSSREPVLYANYQTGDLCAFDENLCRYVNQSDITRRKHELEEVLDSAIPEEFKKFMEGLCK